MSSLRVASRSAQSARARADRRRLATMTPVCTLRSSACSLSRMYPPSHDVVESCTKGRRQPGCPTSMSQSSSITFCTASSGMYSKICALRSLLLRCADRSGVAPRAPPPWPSAASPTSTTVTPAAPLAAMSSRLKHWGRLERRYTRPRHPPTRRSDSMAPSHLSWRAYEFMPRKTKAVSGLSKASSSVAAGTSVKACRPAEMLMVIHLLR
mmetsp:Transcript_6556/g.22120  ORF Transcript_6556/g.22120 Transcript_6556/m.22120 type:complete len:210 (-) Transcript_6556:139-768(-)